MRNFSLWLYRPRKKIVECKACNGCSYQLIVIYSDNRKRKMYGDLGGGTVDKIVTGFLCTIPEMKEKIGGKFWNYSKAYECNWD